MKTKALVAVTVATLISVGVYGHEIQAANGYEQEKCVEVTQNTMEKCVDYDSSIPLSPELQGFAKMEAELNGVPYPLVLAVMEQESRFRLDADGGDSYGLMQINVCHGPREVIIEPHENIRIGCWLLGYLYREYRDWNKVLVAYNCGEAGAERYYFRHGSISSPYSREVMVRSERFAELLGEESVLIPKKYRKIHSDIGQS